MKLVKKGGIETIIATVILAALVIGLIIATVLPAVNETKQLGDDGTTTISSLRDVVNGD